MQVLPLKKQEMAIKQEMATKTLNLLSDALKNASVGL
jgi:hypothetical protein